jgi:hypothetical protein
MFAKQASTLSPDANRLDSLSLSFKHSFHMPPSEKSVNVEV